PGPCKGCRARHGVDPQPARLLADNLQGFIDLVLEQVQRAPEFSLLPRAKPACGDLSFYFRPGPKRWFFPLLRVNKSATRPVRGDQSATLSPVVCGPERGKLLLDRDRFHAHLRATVDVTLQRGVRELREGKLLAVGRDQMLEMNPGGLDGVM